MKEFDSSLFEKAVFEIQGKYNHHLEDAGFSLEGDYFTIIKSKQGLHEIKFNYDSKWLKKDKVYSALKEAFEISKAPH